MNSVRTDLIFDLGMHDGQDTDYYLKKGFRVVAVEANPVLAEQAAERFADEIAQGRLNILNVAVAADTTEFEFYVNGQNSKWSSIHKKWGARGARGFEAITVQGRRLEEIVAEHGAPYYLKIDIEGADLTALQSVQHFPARPDFISVEGGGENFLKLFSKLGYDRFAVVNQAEVPQMCPADPPREGCAVSHVFPMGASGPFGRDIEGPWMTYDEVLAERRAFQAVLQEIAQQFEGDPQKGEKIMRVRARRGLGWYDVHATRKGCL
jgi:FkbM family methyltransferase